MERVEGPMLTDPMPAGAIPGDEAALPGVN